MEAALKAANAAIRRMGSNLDSDDSGDDGIESTAPMPTARRATVEERLTADGNAVLSREAYDFCRKCIGERGLDMKLVDVELIF